MVTVSRVGTLAASGRRGQAWAMEHAAMEGRFDVPVVGGCMLGSASGFGCATRGARTLLPGPTPVRPVDRAERAALDG